MSAINLISEGVTKIFSFRREEEDCRWVLFRQTPTWAEKGLEGVG